MTALGVPVIDIAPFLAGTPGGKAKVAGDVGRACEEIGFLTIVGHGVPSELIDETYAVSKAFFGLPPEEKLKVEHPPGLARGYFPIGARTLAYTLDKEAPPDLNESFAIGPTDVPEDEYYRRPEAHSYFAENVWPERPSQFRRVWTEYFRAMETLAADIMRIFAVALRVPEAFFADKVDRHISVLRAISYPEQSAEPASGQLRAGEHSDYGSLTILRTEKSGLQVRNRSGEWTDVEAFPDSFIVNIGDLMMHWTNDQWISTLHRVVNPSRDKAARLSMVFFHQPNYDAVIRCIESGRGPSRPAKYPPVTSGEWMMRKIRKAYVETRATATT